MSARIAGLLAAAAALGLHGCGGGIDPIPQEPNPIRVGTWNVLCASCAWSTGWGTPIEIVLCNGTQAECTARRYSRLWQKIESLSSSLDVMLLQEADESFMSGHHEDNSSWKLTSLAGQCVVLLSTASSFEVESLSLVSLPTMSSCGDSAPSAVLKRPGEDRVAVVLSVHVYHGLEKDAIHAWYASAIDEMSKLATSATGPRIIGGDFNKNLSEAQLPNSWSALEGNPARGQLGDFTANNENGWLGDIDGFIVEGTSAMPTVHVAGMMPKHVLGFVQGGEMQEWGRFKPNEARDALLFSATGEEPWETVPDSNPRTETLSDHLLVTATFGMSEGGNQRAAVQAFV